MKSLKTNICVVLLFCFAGAVAFCAAPGFNPKRRLDR